MSLRRLIPELPRTVWLYELGVVVNNFGNGIIAPFVVIYLHNARHFSLGTSGAVFATFAGMTFLAAFGGGSLSDRLGPKRSIVVALLIQSAGLAAFAFATKPWQAFASMALVGIGNGGFIPGQSSLLATVVPEESRQAAFSVQRMADNIGLGLGGAVGGLVAVSSRPATFSILFLVDAATIIAFIAMILMLVRRPIARVAQPENEPSGYRAVFRQKLILSVVGLNVIYVLAGYVLFEMVMPAVAKNGVGLSERYIGLVYLLNTFTVAASQLPLLRFFAGRRRMRLLAGMCLLWAVTWVGVAAVVHSRPQLPYAFAAFALAAVLFAIGEGGFSVQNALVADLAPAHIRGRVMALVPSTFTFGFMLGALSSGFLLERSFVLVWLLAAVLLLLAGSRAWALDRRLPEDKRRVPFPVREQELEAASGP